jgi:hypothetical protein
MAPPLRLLLLVVVPAIYFLVAAACASVPPAQAGDIDPVEHASQVKARHEDALLRIPGVVGVGVGLASDGSGPIIQVYVAEATEQVLRDVPSRLEDVGVEVVETGVVRPR